MVLSEESIKERIKSPKAKEQLQKAIYHQNRLKFHSIEYLNESELKSNPYAFEWFASIENNLVSKKFETFKSLIEYPLPSISVVDSIKDQYAKVFEAKDSYFDIHVEKEHKTDLKRFLENLGESSFWQDYALDWLFSDVNCLLMVDLPPVGSDGDPYFYRVDIDQVHDIGENGKELSFVIIKGNKDEKKQHYVVVDDLYYYEYTQEGENIIKTKEAYHGLGKVPCNFLFNEPLINGSLVRKSGITPVLGALDTFVRKYTSKEHLDLYNSFPIYWKYEENDNDEYDRQTIIDDYVDSGKTLLEAESLYERKRGVKNPMIGAGTVIEVPAPSDSTEPDLRDPVGIISPDTTSLEYNTSEIDRLEDRIYRKATGRPQEKEVADRPVASQIQSQYEGERNVLLWVANQFATSRKWLVEVLCTLKLGKEVKCTASFGSEFFIEDERSVLENFKLYKEAGASQGSISMRNKSLIQASTKGKPSERERLELLEHLEPLPTMDIEKAMELVQSDLIEFKEWDLKVNFAERINKFERENGSILTYANEKSFNEKVNAIKSKLYSYGKSKKFDNGLGSQPDRTGTNATIQGKAVERVQT